MHNLAVNLEALHPCLHFNANLAHFLEVMQVVFFVKSGLKLNDYAYFLAIFRRVD